MAKPKTSKRYTREFRQELIALHRAGRSIPELSREFGPTPWTIALWVKQADRDVGHGDGGLTTNEREELARLRRENKRLKMEREILSNV
jgi:transposase